jgi:hypothetical protein
MELQERLAEFDRVWLDLGTGDGQFVRRMAGRHRDRFFIGVDACRENLHHTSRTNLSNALFVIANAQSLPRELCGMASRVSINFPWGSLLESLLPGGTGLVNGLASVAAVRADVDICLNADALASAGWGLEPGADQVERVLNGHGWRTTARSTLTAGDLHTMPTTWAKRLAFGRDPRAIRLCFNK